MSDLVSRLRDLSACKHDDLSIGNEAADRIEYLEQNRDYWHKAALEAQQHRDGANAQIEILERELAEAQRDAGRYRFLREITEVTNRTVDEIDAEIDAAIRGMKDEA